MSAAPNVVALCQDVTTPDETTETEPTGFEDMPLFMTPGDLARILQVTTATLERWRKLKRGPAWVKFPGSQIVRYTRPAVLAWLAECAGGES